jgi:hypothetical protein
MADFVDLCDMRGVLEPSRPRVEEDAGAVLRFLAGDGEVSMIPVPAEGKFIIHMKGPGTLDASVINDAVDICQRNYGDRCMFVYTTDEDVEVRALDERGPSAMIRGMTEAAKWNPPSAANFSCLMLTQQQWSIVLREVERPDRGERLSWVAGA